MTTKISFGEYFDAQRDKIIKDMQNKNAQQNIEWMEAYEKRLASRRDETSNTRCPIYKLSRGNYKKII
jgi:hypothetical protein